MNVAMDVHGLLWAHRNGMTDIMRNLSELKAAKYENTGIPPNTLAGDTLLTWEEAEAVLIARDL